MILFPFNDSRFSFLVANHPLVGQLCTNSKSDRSFYHVWKWHNVQRARSDMRHRTTHALYRSKLWKQNHCQNLQNANPDRSTLEGTAQRIRWPFGWLWLWSLVWFQVKATSCHLTSSKSAWKSTPKCTWMCWRV